VNAIGWCDETWNPMVGCTSVSEACEHCYARAMNARFGCPGGDKTFRPHAHPERLDKPLHWRKPRRIFVCSMSDLFHEAFTWEQVVNVLTTVALCPQHTFIVLTKRPGRARLILSDKGVPSYVDLAVHNAFPLSILPSPWPLPNLHLGVTVETQARADERIPILLDTPAAVRFVCCEPLLGAVKLADPPDEMGFSWLASPAMPNRGIDWVIVGGENGPGARPMQPEWALDLYRQCKAEGVPFWWKGWGRAFRCPITGATIDPACVQMEHTRELPAVSS
jgi:protein gp37